MGISATNRKPSFEEAVAALAAAPLGFRAGDVAAQTGTSRQAAQRRLARLVAAGQLTSTGRARATRYHLGPSPALTRPGGGSWAEPQPAQPRWQRTLPTAGLEEDRVWREVEGALPEL